MEKKKWSLHLLQARGMAVWIYAVCLAIALLVMPGSPALIRAQATTWTFAPKDGGKSEYAFEEKEVDIYLSGSDLSYADYLKMHNDSEVSFESSDPAVAVCYGGFGDGGLICNAQFRGTGPVTFKALKGTAEIASFSFTVKADDLKLEEESSTVLYDESYPGEYGYLSFNNHPIISAESSNPSVCITSLEDCYINEYGEYQDPQDIGEQESQCKVYPMGAGTAAVTVKDSLGKTLKVSITVKESWFSSYMKTTEKGSFYYFTLPHPDTDMPNEYRSQNLHYGDSSVDVDARYGTKVTLKVGKKTYPSVTADQYNRATIKNVKTAKLKTKVTITSELGGQKKIVKGKVVNKASIIPVTIKAKAKKGEVMLQGASKGDVIKITCGGRTLKKQKIKKVSRTFMTIKFKSKKRLKKNQKIKYTLYNKYGQKLASKSYRVGAFAEW